MFVLYVYIQIQCILWGIQSWPELASEWERSTQPRQQQCLSKCKIVETRQLELGWKKGNWKWHTVHCLSTVIQWETDNKEQGAMDFVLFWSLPLPFSTLHPPKSLNRGVNRISSWVLSKSPVYAWRERRKNKSMDGQDKNNIVRRVSPVDATTHETSQRARPTVFFPFFFFLLFLFFFRCCFRYFWMGWWAIKRFRGWKKRTWLEWLKSFPSSWACTLCRLCALAPSCLLFFIHNQLPITGLPFELMEIVFPIYKIAAARTRPFQIESEIEREWENRRMRERWQSHQRGISLIFGARHLDRRTPTDPLSLLSYVAPNELIRNHGGSSSSA